MLVCNRLSPFPQPPLPETLRNQRWRDRFDWLEKAIYKSIYNYALKGLDEEHFGENFSIIKDYIRSIGKLVAIRRRFPAIVE